jgi:hypothetical protein
MNCHLLHKILTHVSIWTKTNQYIEVKDITDTKKSAPYIFLHVEIDNGGRLKTKHYDKRNGITFPKVNSSFISIATDERYSSIISVWGLHFTTNKLQ